MTEQESYNYCANLINGSMKSTIEHAVLNHFGVTVDVNAKVYNGRSNTYVTVHDSKTTDVDSKMRGNKILRCLFSTAEIKGSAWYDEEGKAVCIRWTVYYNHNYGNGSNGHDIGMMYAFENDKVKWRKN